MDLKPKIGWEHATTFEQSVIKLYEQGKIMNPEFEWLRDYGKDRIDKIIAEHEKGKGTK